jgi:hypothetical protein
MLKLVLLIVGLVVALAVWLAIALRDDPPDADMAGGHATATAATEFQPSRARPGSASPTTS